MCTNCGAIPESCRLRGLPMCESGECEQLMRYGIKQLNAWMAGTKEGDVCSGSYPISGQ